MSFVKWEFKEYYPPSQIHVQMWGLKMFKSFFDQNMAIENLNRLVY